MKFRSQFDKRDRVPQNVGSRIRQLYTSSINEDGEIELLPSGTENLYDMIQSHKDSCDIHVLMARFANGDASVLSQRQGAYGDFTQLPTTYAGLLNAVIAGENYFNSLPLETRAKFDHSFERFMISMDNMPKFLETLGVAQPEPAPAKPEPAPVDRPTDKE